MRKYRRCPIVSKDPENDVTKIIMDGFPIFIAKNKVYFGSKNTFTTVDKLIDNLQDIFYYLNHL